MVKGLVDGGGDNLQSVVVSFLHMHHVLGTLLPIIAFIELSLSKYH